MDATHTLAQLGIYFVVSRIICNLSVILSCSSSKRKHIHESRRKKKVNPTITNVCAFVPRSVVGLVSSVYNICAI